MQIGRGTWHRMSSKADNTSNTSNADLCSIVVNFVAVGYVLAELELLLLLLSPAPSSLAILLLSLRTMTQMTLTTLIAYRARVTCWRIVQRRLLSAVMIF